MVYCEPDGKEAMGSFLHHGDEIVASAGNNSKKRRDGVVKMRLKRTVKTALMTYKGFLKNKRT